MKKIFMVLAIAFLAVSCNKTTPVVENPKPINNQEPIVNLSTYSSIPYSFEFKYPQDFGFAQASYGSLSDQIVQVQPLKNLYPDTNYVDSAFTVSSSYVKNRDACFINLDDGKALSTSKVINGVTYFVGKTSGAGAGNFYGSTIYRTLKESTCYELSLTIHTANIANFDPGTKTEIDQAKPMVELEQILNSFKFTK